MADFIDYALAEARRNGIPTPSFRPPPGVMTHYACDQKDKKKSCRVIWHLDGVKNAQFYDHRGGGGDKPVFSVKGTMPDGTDAGIAPAFVEICSAGITG